MHTIKKYLSEATEEHIPEWKKKINENAQKTILIDFDGVIHAYSKGYEDGTIYDPPQKGVEEALKVLIDKGYRLVMCSARIKAGDAHGKPEMVSQLKKYDLLKYFDKITCEKEPCVVFIDDSAVRHTDWDSTFKQLKKLDIL